VPRKKKDKAEPNMNMGGNAGAMLRGFVERIERLVEERDTINDDIKDVMGEAKSQGYDTKAVRKILAERRQDEQERVEFEAILDTYRHALGMLTYESAPGEDEEEEKVV
jgi:uncharacterized protein (UPF0335 family)